MYQVDFKAVSNREQWVGEGELRDEDDVLVDLTGGTFVMALTDRETKRQVLLGSTDDGRITLLEPGVFKWTIPVEIMHGICPETYNVGITGKLNDGTFQITIGTVAVLDGVVP